MLHLDATCALARWPARRCITRSRTTSGWQTPSTACGRRCDGALRTAPCKGRGGKPPTNRSRPSRARAVSVAQSRACSKGAARALPRAGALAMWLSFGCRWRRSLRMRSYACARSARGKAAWMGARGLQHLTAPPLPLLARAPDAQGYHRRLFEAVFAFRAGPAACSHQMPASRRSVDRQPNTKQLKRTTLFAGFTYTFTCTLFFQLSAFLPPQQHPDQHNGPVRALHRCPRRARSGMVCGA